MNRLRLKTRVHQRFSPGRLLRNDAKTAKLFFSSSFNTMKRTT